MNKTLTLPLSVALNTILAVACIYLLAQRKREQPTTAPAPAPATSETVATAAPARPPAAVSGATPKPGSFDWRSVESEDYRKYIANLRSIGCPEETIRDIITADVNKLYDSRRKQLSAGEKKFEYWKTGNPFAAMMDETKMQRAKDLAQEKRALLKELLGVEPVEKPDVFGGVNPFETILDFLPEDKHSKVMELEQKYSARLAKVLGSGSPPDAEDMKEMKKVQTEKDAEMAQLMSPEEKEQYDLRMSQTAMMMRMQLDGFDASEQEFKDIFKLRKAFDDEFGPFGMMTNDSVEQEKRRKTEQQLNEQLKQALGEERYADYQREQDFVYKGIKKIAERQGLPKEAAVKVHDMRQTVEAEMQKVRTDTRLTEEQRREALKAMRTETERAITETLGEEGFKSLQSQPTAYWIRNISPDQAPPPPVPTQPAP